MTNRHDYSQRMSYAMVFFSTPLKILHVFYINNSCFLKGELIFFTGEALEDCCIQNGKSILLFSTPHSGKTTLLEGILNFILGVSSSDGYRLSFAPELTSKVGNKRIQPKYKTTNHLIFVNTFIYDACSMSA